MTAKRKAPVAYNVSNRKNWGDACLTKILDNTNTIIVHSNATSCLVKQNLELREIFPRSVLGGLMS